ncbi:MAG: NAD(P)/FAD-dependent oxidoreductase [Faecalibacterium sp.]
MLDFDIIVIGAGAIGCAVARELSRYQANICVIEKYEDVCAQTSKANSGIVHAGFDAATGTLMAKMNVVGNALMEPLSKELDFAFVRNGSLVVCLSPDDMPALNALYKKGIANGVPNLTLLDKAALQALETNITPNAYAALYAPTGGIVCPFGLTIALAENAAANGTQFRFNTEVNNLVPLPSAQPTWRVITNQGEFTTKYIVNAAGVYADIFHNMVSAHKIHITPRRGDYCLLDKSAGKHVSHTIFQLPKQFGKGVLVTPTVHGNLLVGPTAIDIDDREGTNTTAQGLNALLTKASGTVKELPLHQTITSFSGLRAHEDGHEFILGEVADAPGFINCAGIESPGLTSAPAIGVFTANLLQEKLNLTAKENFIATRKGILDPKTLPKAERIAFIKENPTYGNIVCRCEEVTEGEILDAIHRPLGATSFDGIKRRTRAQMGRCQGGFCSPRIMELLSRELDIPMEQVTKCGGRSNYIVGSVKDCL